MTLLALFPRFGRCGPARGKKVSKTMTRVATAERQAVTKSFELDTPPCDEAICIAAHADYRREDFVFPRTQSLKMRGLKWENRLPPMKPWGSNLVANLALSIFA
jgi:hypothetical protein